MRTVLAASALAIVVAEQSWLAGVLAVSFARFWGELAVVAPPRWEAPGHCTAPEHQIESAPISEVQCKSDRVDRHSLFCIIWCKCKLYSTLGVEETSPGGTSSTCTKHSQNVLLEHEQDLLIEFLAAYWKLRNHLEEAECYFICFKQPS